MNKEGLLVVVSAPSGTGKTTVCHALLEMDSNFSFSVSCTTRTPRPTEQEAVDYYFVSKETFEDYIKKGVLAEWEEIFGYYYGTLISSLENALEKREILLLDIDVKGGLTIKELYPDYAITIFLLPPNYKELENRLRHRGADSDESIVTRKERIEEEMKLGENFDYVIINDKLEETVEQVETIIEERVNQWQ